MRGYVCTRDHGHKGLHAAHGASMTIPVAWWKEGATKPTELYAKAKARG